VSSFGFGINESNKCVYSKFEHEKCVVICLYVDDMLSFDIDLEEVKKTKGVFGRGENHFREK